MAVKTVAQMCAKALSVDIIRSDILSLCWLAITIVSLQIPMGTSLQIISGERANVTACCHS